MVYPEFRLHRAVPGTVPEGVEYAGTVRTTDGRAFGIHARVVEVEGRKEFAGGCFEIEEGE